MTAHQIERLLPQFEGLVFETARQIVEQGVELEFDDVRQLLRIKIWTAIRSYDAGHEKRMPLRRFVFMCVTNLRKDIEKRPRRYNDSIERIRDRSTELFGLDGSGSFATGASISDWFDLRYLSVDAEQVYFEVEDEALPLPSTLTGVERQLVTLRLEGKLLSEIERELGLSRAQREKVLRSVREKLADWNPAQRSAPMRPLPDAEPRRSHARAALAF